MVDVKMNAKVWIVSQRKIDGRYNRGQVVGLEKTYGYLGFVSQTQFLSDFKLARVKVAYVDVFTGKGSAEWFSLDDLSKDKPADATA
jgi:hypothetical protein